MRKHIFISGRVQGVGFRHFTRKNAEALNVDGWVKNLADGRVEAVFEGSEEAVQDLIKRCKRGPAPSRVEELEVKDAENEKNTLKGFQVRH